ncbi:YitT family protein [Pseudalkalibacillus caeni]|uniref:YitT family protein n=1 Tax=Exobacillus caeni TaxID=2574798 RepID=A0A5R9FD77_9BACL|nr:YitT family protein [Pseudalkalibacillus caeni]TLS38514.1 YitT family protein [Pseudalkalibacillus caeni]
MKKKYTTMDPKLHVTLEYIYVLIGSAFVALAFNLFLLPNQIASGGVSGISTILYGVFQWKPSYVQWAFNIPLFISGVILLGRQFGAKTLVGTLFLPFVVYLSEDFPAVTLDPLLGALFGGIGVGIGLGIVFRGKASTGGTDLAAQIIHKYTGFSLGACVFMIDGLIVATSAFVFSFEQALYALIGMYLTGKTIDIVQLGFSYSKMALIISEKEDEMRKGIFEVVNRGVTQISGKGGFTNDERPILMCVVNQNEVTKLKQVVKAVDPSAFVIVASATEVLGEGFKRE